MRAKEILQFSSISTSTFTHPFHSFNPHFNILNLFVESYFGCFIFNSPRVVNLMIFSSFCRLSFEQNCVEMLKVSAAVARCSPQCEQIYISLKIFRIFHCASRCFYILLHSRHEEIVIWILSRLTRDLEQIKSMRKDLIGFKIRKLVRLHRLLIGWLS